MITLHNPSAEGWEGNGICVLTPTECLIEEEAGGIYELTLTHPISDDLRARAIQRGYLIKAPVPRMETPFITNFFEGNEGEPGHVIYRVSTPAGKTALRTKGNFDAPVLEWMKTGTEVIYHGTGGMANWRIVTSPSGTTGKVYNTHIEYVRTEPGLPAKPGYTTVVPARQVRDQLFRIYSVETSSGGKSVVAKARHISYDLIGNIVKEYSAKDADLQTALNAMNADLSNGSDFTFYTNITGTITSDMALKNPMEVLLDGDAGIVPQKNARLVRDNYDVFVLSNEERDRGVRIAYGKNLLGITVTEDQSGIITRIMPIGKDKDGKPLKLPELFVDSAYLSSYPTVYAKAISYDVQVKDATEDEEEVTTEDAYTLLRDKAAEDFAKGADLPDIDVDVEFVMLGDTEEYKAYKDLMQVFMYDTVGVSYSPMGMDFAMQVTGDTFDAILGRYKKVKLSTKLFKKTATITGDQLAGGSINGSAKIAAGTIDSAALRNYAVKLVHLASTIWPDAPLLENAAVANAVPLDRFVAELALKASAESLQAYETIQNSIARVAVLEQSAQNAISVALAQAMDQVSAARADLDAYKSEVKEYVDWATGTGLRFSYPGSPVTNEIANDGLYIKYNGAKAAVFGLTGTHTPRLVVEDKASFGNPTDGYIQFIHTSRGLAIKAGDTI